MQSQRGQVQRGLSNAHGVRGHQVEEILNRIEVELSPTAGDVQLTDHHLPTRGTWFDFAQPLFELLRLVGQGLEELVLEVLPHCAEDVFIQEPELGPHLGRVIVHGSAGQDHTAFATGAELRCDA